MASKFGQLASQWSWMPLGLTAWLFTPVRTVRVHIPDGGFSDGYTHYRGFPFLAASDAPVFSLSTDVYILPLIANWTFVGVLSWTLVYLWRKRAFLRYRQLDWVCGAPVYAFGAGALYVTIVWLYFMDTFFHWWIDRSGWESVEGFVLPLP